MTLPALIRHIRTTLGLTRREFAARLLVTPSAIRGWEAARNTPGIASALRLADLDPTGAFAHGYPWTRPGTVMQAALVAIVSEPGIWTRIELAWDLSAPVSGIDWTVRALRDRGLITLAHPYTPTARGRAHIENVVGLGRTA